MASSARFSLRTFRTIIRTFAPKTVTQRVVAYGTVVSLLSYTLSQAYQNYQSWLASGPGGPPYNPLGWLAQGALTLITSNDTIRTSVYDQEREKKRYGDAGQQNYLDMELPRRTGMRPFVPAFVAPQRQAPGQGQSSSPSMQLRQDDILRQISASNPSLVQLGESHLETRGNALWLTSSTLSDRPSTDIDFGPPRTSALRGEIAHFHLARTDVASWKGEADGSGHVTLSLVDAKEVVAKGWGQRHRVSGVFLPLGYTLLYAPRTDEELHVVENIVKASVRYMTNGAKVQ